MTSATFLTSQQWSALDERIKRVDEDRWLSSRYASADQRLKLLALYAFIYELARVRTVVSEPALGAIRFQWWRDALQELAAGKPPRQHEVMLAIAESGLITMTIAPLIDSYQDAFDAQDRSQEPEGEVMLLACQILDSDLAAPWREEALRLGTVFAMARRLPPGHGHDVPPLERISVPSGLRPAVAHAAIARDYISGQRPGGLRKRWRVLRTMLTGAV